ncbi:GntR family transcriptional regulator [Belnapia sp. T6]|uniref:GntR family transcriptional regulator n=1 Tax=Belnapia mucosa TaxID=2804532 RepID=A0ABS1V7H5_9PROT|nr:GntR family transcriptional regulator [Belnapia mucosa]MBL6457623.1 GntR family transcriptional regulator [Belnapia mucosa]
MDDTQSSAATDPRSLEERAYQSLRRALVEGSFAPGQKLSIRKIASALGTSPMPARTALRRLTAEQAIDLLPSGTAIVPRLTRAAFAELGAIRAELEPLAVRLATPRLDAAMRQRLGRIYADGMVARRANQADVVLQADREFLFTLYRAAAAPMLLGLIEALWLRRGPLFREARWVILGRVPMANRHAQILEALDAGDARRAAEALCEEIESTTAYLLETMRFVDDPGAEDGLGALRPLTRVRRRPARAEAPAPEGLPERRAGAIIGETPGGGRR